MPGEESVVSRVDLGVGQEEDPGETLGTQGGKIRAIPEGNAEELHPRQEEVHHLPPGDGANPPLAKKRAQTKVGMTTLTWGLPPGKGGKGKGEDRTLPLVPPKDPKTRARDRETAREIKSVAGILRTSDDPA